MELKTLINQSLPLIILCGVGGILAGSVFGNMTDTGSDEPQRQHRHHPGVTVRQRRSYGSDLGRRYLEQGDQRECYRSSDPNHTFGCNRRHFRACDMRDLQPSLNRSPNVRSYSRDHGSRRRRNFNFHNGHDNHPGFQTRVRPR